MKSGKQYMNKMMFNRQIEIMKKNQTEILELKNTKSEMKNAIENMDIRLDQGEERICVEDTSLQIIQSENKEKN